MIGKMLFNVVAMAAKLGADILVTRLEYIVSDVIMNIDDRFTLGTAVSGPGAICFFGIHPLEHEDMTVELVAFEILNRLACMLMSRPSGGEAEISLNNVVSKRVASFNAF